DQCEAISGWPFSGRSAQFPRTSPQFILEKLSHTGSHSVGQSRLLPACVTVVIGPDSSAWLIWIAAQERKNNAAQPTGIPLQIIEKIKAKQIWVHIAPPSRDDLARIREREDRWLQQPLNHCVRISCVKSTNPSKTHPHGQLRPGSFNWITGKKNHLQVWEITNHSLNDLIIQHRIGWRDVARKTRPFVGEQARIILH